MSPEGEAQLLEDIGFMKGRMENIPCLNGKPCPSSSLSNWKMWLIIAGGIGLGLSAGLTGIEKVLAALNP